MTTTQVPRVGLHQEVEHVSMQIMKCLGHRAWYAKNIANCFSYWMNACVSWEQEGHNAPIVHDETAIVALATDSAQTLQTCLANLCGTVVA